MILSLKRDDVLYKFFKYLILIPVAIIFVGFMISHRHPVLINFDPFNANAPLYAIELPLYLIMIGAIILGILFGGIADWISQGKYRKTARIEKKKNRELVRETEHLKDHISAQTKTTLIEQSRKK